MQPQCFTRSMLALMGRSYIFAASRPHLSQCVPLKQIKLFDRRISQPISYLGRWISTARRWWRHHIGDPTDRNSNYVKTCRPWGKRGFFAVYPPHIYVKLCTPQITHWHITSTHNYIRICAQSGPSMQNRSVLLPRNTGMHLLTNRAINSLINGAQNLLKVHRYHVLNPAFRP